MRNGLAGCCGGVIAAVCTLVLLSPRSLEWSATAEAATGAGNRNADLLVFSSPTRAPGQQLLYIVDSRGQSFCIYRVDEQNGTVKLEAVRNFGWDLRVREFNNLPPEVGSIQRMLSRN